MITERELGAELEKARIAYIKPAAWVCCLATSTCPTA